MKILVFAHRLDLGGSQVNAIELAATLRDRYGHDVVLFATPGPSVKLADEQRLRFLNNTLAHQIACKEKLDHALESYSFIKKFGLYERIKSNGFYDRLLDLWLHRHICRELKDTLPSASGERRSSSRSAASATPPSGLCGARTLISLRAARANAGPPRPPATIT